MLVGVYLDPRRSSTTSKSAESGNYEAFVMVLYCHFINEVMFNRPGVAGAVLQSPPSLID